MTHYLIAHKVRGQPAFDVAKQMSCPICGGTGERDYGTCEECDAGYWWIIPTSGHRARPYWHAPMVNHGGKTWIGTENEIWGFTIPDMPPSLPDHYSCNASPEPAKPSGLLKLLGLGRAATQIKRRV